MLGINHEKSILAKDKIHPGWIIVILLIFSVPFHLTGAAEPEKVGSPVNLAYTAGNFWINYTWSTDANVDSFNVSVNGNWTNGTKNFFINTTTLPHGWVYISVAGFNAKSKKLSRFEYGSAQVPNNPISLINIRDKYYLNEGETLYIDADSKDTDNDSGTFSTDASKGQFNISTGVFSWTTAAGDNGIYNWKITVDDGYGSTMEKQFTVIVYANIPGSPVNLIGLPDKNNFRVNYTWLAGANTDSFNVSVNGIWDNGSNAMFRNVTSSPHGRVNISVAGYNVTSQLLSDTVFDDTQIPDNPIILTNVSSRYDLTEGETLYIDADYTDADGDRGIFTTNSRAGIDPSSGVLSWKTGTGDGGVYNWQINVSDGYGSTSTKEFVVTVGAYTPEEPVNLACTTGNFWANYTWSAGMNTSSFNFSVNGNWVNGTKNFSVNTTTLPHGWVNISIASYNATSQLLSDIISQDTRIPNNPVTLTNVSNRYFLNEGSLLYINANYTDRDGDDGLFATNADKGTFDPSEGILSWQTASGDGGIYTWLINVSDGYGSVSTQQFKVIVPLRASIRFIEPAIIEGKEQWIVSRSGHIGKYIGVDRSFTNTGEDTLILAITEIYNNTRNELLQLTLEKDQSLSYRNEFEINYTGVKGGMFNYTLEIEAKGYNSRGFTFRYSNITTVSLPVVPIYKMKRASHDIIIVAQNGKTPPVTYTLEANSSVNLTDISIYDPFYPDNGGYFNISKLEVNGSRNTCWKDGSIVSCRTNFTYSATRDDLNKKTCEEGFSCLLNLATFTGIIESSGELINDTEYVEIWLNPQSIETDKGKTVKKSGGGGGGGGLPPGEDFENIERREVREMDVVAGQSTTYLFKAAEPVMLVAFESRVSENEVPVGVEILKNRSKKIKKEAPGHLYKYFNVFVGTGGFRNKVSNGVIVFRVNNTWLKENSLDPEDIGLYKWKGKWVRKDTDIVETKPGYTYFAGLAEDFSSFAIAGDVTKTETDIRPTTNDPMARDKPSPEKPKKDTKNPKAGGSLKVSLVFIILGVVIPIIHNFKNKLKK